MENGTFSYDEAFGASPSASQPSADSGGFSYEDAFGLSPTPTPAAGPAAPGFIPTIKRTGGQMLTTAATTAEDVIGPNAATRTVKEAGQGIIDRNPAGIRSLRDLVNSPWLAVKESVGQFAPQIAAAAAGGAAGARAGRVFGPAGAAIGGAVGGLAPIFTQEYGGIRQEQQASGQEDKARALAAAIPATALERVGMGKALDVLKGVPGKPSTILKEVGKGVLKEGATEGAQNVIEQWGAFKNPTTGENLEDTALSAAMGAIGGGVMGAGAGVVDGARARSQQKVAEQQGATEAPADGSATISERSANLADGQEPAAQPAAATLPDVAEYGGLIDQMVKPENQQQYRDTLARALDEQRPPEERKAAADALHQAFNPEQFQRSQAAAPAADPAEAPAPAAPPAINPADGPMSKAAVMAGDLGLTPVTQPAPPAAPDVRQQLGAALDQLAPEQQRAARMTLADLERADLPAGVRAMRESEARALIPAATPTDQETLANIEPGRVVRTFEPQPADLPDVASYAGFIDTMVRPEAQPAFRQALATAQDQTLPLSVRSEAENALHANFAPAAYQRARRAQPDARVSLQPRSAPNYGNGIDFTTEARAVDPVEARIAALAVADGRTPGESMRLNEAHALRQRAAQDGIAVSVVPHPSGRGFDVQPTLRLSPQERNQVPATAEAGALSFDPGPTGRMVAGPEGVRPETRAEAVARNNAAQAERQALEAERQRRAELGMSNITPVRPLPAEQAAPALTYDNAPTGRMVAGEDGVRQERRAEVVNRANEPAPMPDTVASASGAPFPSQQAAQRELRRRELTGTHEVVPASGDASLGYVLRARDAEPTGSPLAETTRAPNWRTNALQAARVARSLDLDVRGMDLQRMVATVDAADAARALQAQDTTPVQPENFRLQAEPAENTAERPTSLPADGGAAQRGTSSTRSPIVRDAAETVAAGADESSAADQFNARQPRAQQQDRSRPVRPADASTAQNRRSVGFPEAAGAAQQAARIEDFGETLPGARKMLYAEAYADGMAKAKELDVKAHPLSKTWPEPDYAKLLEGGSAPDTVALARALRDAVPTKPQSTWKLRGWSDRVTMLRGFADDLLSGRNDPAAVRAELHRDSIPRGIANQAALYEAMGHERSLKDIKLDAGRYSMYEGVAYDPPRTIWTVSRAAKASSFGNWPRELAKGDTREAAIEAFKRRSAELLAEQSAPARGASFEIYSKRAGGAREFFIGKKIGRNVAELKTGFPDVKAARAYLADNQTELENLLQRYKDVPPVRNSQNAPRIGQDYRKGGDATPEQFQEAFGFRGVQFGNYVEGPRRQQDLNRAYDALMDLAGVLNVPPRALSLGGRLGLAFGARGSGGQNAAAAHYEPGSVVINLTKREGAGSLAHEWWHALDNYFSRQRGDGAGYMTAEERQGQGVREEMRAAFREVRSAINRTGMLERSKKLDDRRTKEYWTTKPEMSARAFESYVVAKLQDQSAGNDYLANIVPAGVFALEGAYPYPTAGEMPQIRGAFDAFFQAVEKRQEGDGSVSLYSTGEPGPGRGLSLEEAQQAVQDALARLRNPPPVDVVARSAELGVGAPDGVMGVTRVKERRIVIVAGSHRSAGAVAETLFHEMFHLGLRNVLPGADYVQSMLDLAKRDARVQEYANRWKQEASDAPQQLQVLREQGYRGSELQAQYEALAVEEGLAVVAQELRAQKQAGTRMGLRLRTLANWLASVADRMGMERLGAAIRKMTYNEAESFVMKAIDNAGSAPLSGVATAGPDISRYRTTPAAAVESSMGEMTAVQEKVWKKVAGTATVPTLKQRAEALRQNFAVRAKQALVDQFAPIQDVSQEAYMLARMSKGADGTMEAAMLYGRPFLRDGVPDVDVKEGGFANVLASLKGEQDRFLWWVAAQRAERLKAEGKENLMSVDDIGVLKTLNAGTMADGTNRAPVYAKAMADFNSFNESVLKMALDSGLIDQGAYDLFRDQPYVPFYRLMADGEMQGRRFSSGLVNQKAWQKLKGGTEKLNADLLQNTLLNWSHLYAAAARNRAALATMDAAEKLGVAYPVQEGTKGAVKVMRNGEAQHWAVEDPYLLEAVSALNYTASPLMKPLAKMKQVLTFGVTVNPTFKIRNLIRDSLSAIAQSELGYNPASNVARGWKLTARDSQTYASMLASGGIIKFGTQENTDRLRDQVAKLGGVVLDQQGWKKLTGQLSTVWHAYSELGDRAENVNRAALYDRLVAKGHSHAEASFMARDLMDFSMSGNHAVVRFLTQSVPFLNARLQGLYKLGRAAHDNPRRFAMVAGAVSLASLGLMAAYSDDDDWKKREDWDRDSYWWFKIGGTAYRIPKPFEVGAIGTLAERTAELMMSDEMTGARFRQRLAHMVSQTFSFDPMPQAFKPLIDIYSNKDSFTGRAIESQADQRLRSQDRYDERTSEVARMLGSWGLPDPARLLKGEWADLSPKQVDYLLRGYFSWAGTTAVAAADAIARPALDRGERPDMRLKDMFVVGNFAESLPSGSSRYVTQMYEQAKQVEQAYASYRDALKRGDLEKAQEIMRDEAPKLQHRAAFNNASERLAALNQRSKAITADPSMSGEEKRQRLDTIERLRAEIGYRMSALSIAP
ncbi:LPD5 domain-containing protein [Paracidovorax anthurii]|uniref:Large polyvalent protein-associated domain-containing protein n=1 Tax=Paracidovorax anthurii TaxID=78229 RepID=A0A328ZRT4_9BURK|nr:LPD5 domain-containing protein [Paracidovorax anthurii]RAR85036.1 hypothetical protein AX018_1008129 [Paracidovorax anthurii]